MSIAVSACLLGEKCRYDGDSKRDTRVLEFVKDEEVVPFCPENALYGSPREKMKLVYIESMIEAITVETDRIVTDDIKREAYYFMKENPQVRTMVVKSKSPSCSLRSTPIFDKKGRALSFKVAGVFTNTIREQKDRIDIFEERDI